MKSAGDVVPPCQAAAAAAGGRLAGRRGARSSHILVAETGSSETWHGHLGPRITHPDHRRRRRLLLLLDDCSSQAAATGPPPPPPAAAGASAVAGAAAGSLVPRQGPPQACPPASHARRRRRNRGDLGPEFPSARGGSEDPIESGPPRDRDRIGRRDLLRFSSRLLPAPAAVSWRRVGVGLRRREVGVGAKKEEEEEDWSTPPHRRRGEERGTGEETGARTPGWGLYSPAEDGGMPGPGPGPTHPAAGLVCLPACVLASGWAWLPNPNLWSCYFPVLFFFFCSSISPQG